MRWQARCAVRRSCRLTSRLLRAAAAAQLRPDIQLHTVTHTARYIPLHTVTHTAAQLLPDLYYMVQSQPEDEFWWSVLGAFFSTAFTLLQLYWSYLILKQIFKGSKKGSAPRKAPPGSPDEWEEEYQELQPPREDVCRR